MRSLVKDSGLDFSETFTQVRADLDRIRSNANDKIEGKVLRANEILIDIAELNKRILSVEVGGNDPNDLKDRRDNLTTELAEFIDIDIVDEPRGLRITFGNYLLVEGNVSNFLGTQANPQDLNITDVTFGGAVINFVLLLKIVFGAAQQFLAYIRRISNHHIKTTVLHNFGKFFIPIKSFFTRNFWPPSIFRR